MECSFSKYHGTGNDFILIDGRGQETGFLTEPVIRHLCHRRFGIGADGLMVLLPDEKTDFRMLYFNADGKEGSMCGNGGRCLVSFAHRLGACGPEARFVGVDGTHEAKVLPGGEIELRLKAVDRIQPLPDGYLLDTGSPHFVRFVNGLGSIDMEKDGRSLRWEDRFAPGGVNVNFVEMLPSGHLAVRTFERGVEAETYSCGTGVTASSLVAALRDKPGPGRRVVETLGGTLEVRFQKTSDNDYREIFLIGPAVHVFDGTLHLPVEPTEPRNAPGS
ncbi:MAG: diaminopimelate epimerase [Bacteroidales bacterium]